MGDPSCVTGERMSGVDAEAAVNAGPGDPVEVSFNQRDMILYALGIGETDLRYTFENHEDFAVHPLYPIVLAFKGTTSDIDNFPSEAMMASKPPPGSPNDMMNVVDAERYLEILEPLPYDGGEFKLKTKCTSMQMKKSGCVMETESMLVDDSGKEFVKMIGASFFRGKQYANEKSAGTSFFSATTVPGRAPDKVVEELVPKHQPQLYRLSGDYNGLHIDPEFATMVGFPAPINHGLCTMGFATRHVLTTYAGNDPALFKSVRTRFASPVMPGDTIVTEMWNEGNKVFFQCKVKSTGKVCINNACMELHSLPKAKL